LQQTQGLVAVAQQHLVELNDLQLQLKQALSQEMEALFVNLTGHLVLLALQLPSLEV
jgi:hypothetical protein